MKTLQTLAVTALLALLGMIGIAQAADSFGVDTRPAPSGYVHVNMLTNSGPYLLPGSLTTNIPAAMANLLPVPFDGFGIGFRTGGTNVADTTNLIIVLEAIVFPTGARAGGTQVVDNAVWNVSTPAVAAALPTGYDYVTNFSPYILTVSPFRADAVRIRSIQNTNLNSLWLTNIFQLRN